MSNYVTMYGWFEPGGGVNKYFNNTIATDILLRSAFENNKIVIGNSSNTNAALYISSNNVGLKKLPDSNYTLDINGKTRLDEMHIGSDIVLTSNEISFGNICTITNDGLINNDMILTSSIKKNITNIQAAFTSISQTAVNQYRITVEFTGILDHIYFDVDKCFKINKHIFQIKNKLNDTTYDIEFIRNITNPFPLQTNNTYSIDILEELYNQDTYVNLSIFLYITNFTLVHPYSAIVNISILDEKYKDFLKVGHYYAFSGSVIPDNLFVLESYVINNDLTGTLNVRTVNYADVAVGSFPTIAVELQIKSSISFTTTETNVNLTISDIDNTIVTLQYPDLDNVLNALEENSVFIRHISFDDLTKEIEYIKGNGDSTVEMKLKTPLQYATPPPYFADIVYTRLTVPLKITSVEQLEPNLFKHRIEDPLKMLNTLSQYSHIHHNNINIKIISIEEIDQCVYIDKDLSSFINGFIYVIPYRDNRSLSITNDNCFVGQKLSIGTDIPWETLTVKGDISLQNQIIYHNQDKTSSFTTRYEDTTFYLSDKMEIGSNATNVYQDFIVKGNCAAENFLNYSDKRIKKNIKHISFETDRDIVQNIDVYDYQFKKDNSYSKGLIAQNVERYMPYAVVSSLQVLNSICKTCKISKESNVIVIDDIDDTCVDDISVGTSLSILLENGKSILSPITYTKYANKTLYVKIEYNLSDYESIYVAGPYTNVKSINYNLVTMTLFSCVKSLMKDIEEMKQDMIQLRCNPQF